MCKTIIQQEEADFILAVGHKVRYQGQECVITSIRVWHDLGTLLGPPFRVQPVFDLQGANFSGEDIPIEDLELWFPPAAPSEVREKIAKKLWDGLKEEAGKCEWEVANNLERQTFYDWADQIIPEVEGYDKRHEQAKQSGPGHTAEES